MSVAPSSYADAAALVPILALAAAAHGALMVGYRMARFPHGRGPSGASGCSRSA